VLDWTGVFGVVEAGGAIARATVASKKFAPNLLFNYWWLNFAAPNQNASFFSGCIFPIVFVFHFDFALCHRHSDVLCVRSNVWWLLKVADDFNQYATDFSKKRGTIENLLFCPWRVSYRFNDREYLGHSGGLCLCAAFYLPFSYSFLAM
jgi:hypothetical protein